MIRNGFERIEADPLVIDKEVEVTEVLGLLVDDKYRVTCIITHIQTYSILIIRLHSTHAGYQLCF
jgi:hypothetical protein